jgi:hypothetical protein
MKMTIRRQALLGTTLVVSILAASAALAHHSFAMFKIDECQAITGKIRNFQFTYPHTWIWLFADTEDGTEDIWGFEGEPPSNLAEDGWTRTSLKKGDAVRITFSPLADGRHGGAYSVVELLDTGEILVGPRGHDDPCVKAFRE